MADREKTPGELAASELLLQHGQAKYHPSIDDTATKTHAGQLAMQNCITLFQKDYEMEFIDNKSGRLCSHYPSQIILMADKNDGTQGTRSLKEEKEELQKVMEEAASSRCRSRFVTPVILYNGQYICRSATVAGGKELTLNLTGETVRFVADMALAAGTRIVEHGWSAVAYVSNSVWGLWQSAPEPSEEMQQVAQKTAQEAIQKAEEEETQEEVKAPEGGEQAKSYWTLYTEYLSGKITKDTQLLQKLNVVHIFDLMVEDAKVKYFMTVSSSEKADALNSYKDFKIYSFPYPGCEFFAKYKAHGTGQNLFYNWASSENTATANVGEDNLVASLANVDWKKYKKWDLVRITKNYMQAMIRTMSQGDKGMLVHCISGWDRTPLFVSLLRMSLWADGLIHKSLEPAEMLYLTLAYDWYLFGHGYHDRRKKEEEVLPFCFEFLPYIADEFFSLNNQSRNDATKPTEQLLKEPVHYVEEDPSEKLTPSKKLAEDMTNLNTASPSKRQSSEGTGGPSPSKKTATEKTTPPTRRSTRLRSTSASESPRRRSGPDKAEGGTPSPRQRQASEPDLYKKSKENLDPLDSQFSTKGWDDPDEEGYEIIELCGDWQKKPKRWQRLHLVNWAFRNALGRSKRARAAKPGFFSRQTAIQSTKKPEDTAEDEKPGEADKKEADDAAGKEKGDAGEDDIIASVEGGASEAAEGEERMAVDDGEEKSAGVMDYLYKTSGMQWLLGDSGISTLSGLFSGLRGEDPASTEEGAAAGPIDAKQDDEQMENP